LKSVDRLKHPVTTSSTSKYAEEVAGVLAVNGRFFMLCSSGKGLSTGWTRRVTHGEIEAIFFPFFNTKYIRDESFAARIRKNGRRA